MCHNYRYLATGDQLLSIAFAYRIGESTASSVIKHTCTVLSKVLAPLYVASLTSEKWKEIARKMKRNRQKDGNKSPDFQL